MNISMIQAAAAMNANSRWQDMISENLASSAIPGFRKQDLSFAAVQGGMITPTKGALGAGSASYVLPQTVAATNFEPGEITSTGVPTNVALEGAGFFEIQSPSGTPVYTRSGDFRINTQGELTTAAGYRVMGEGGPITIDPRLNTPVSISATGEVSQGGENKGKLKVVDYNNPQLLTYLGSGLFAANNPKLVPMAAAKTTVRQGCLESSNTSPVREMTNLISTLRTYEANQRVIQLSDDRMSRAISELGNPS
jgi:flagellar basal body rod protein FlgG